ncbi:MULTISPECIES: ABC transporter permease [unclassified Haladaptatus]|uniref:ABC transporter permease n=1 Tax=unclassified Haladaptatus TaxID=2622732 RepID=UPI0023E7C2E5|nr:MULTISPECIES: ABC transporter permease [unclassified Haladaptatus]
MFEPIYRRFPAVMMARRNLTRNKIRSALAMLGIVIGVLAIASLGIFGNTLQVSVTESLGDIGSEIIVSPAFEEGVSFLSDRDVQNVERAAPGATVTPVAQKQGVIEFSGEQQVIQVFGVSRPGDLYEAEAGSIPPTLRSGALVGTTLAEDLGVRVGNSIVVDGTTYRVSAILAESQAFSPTSANNGVVIPVEAFPAREYGQIVVDAGSGLEANATAEAIRGLNDRDRRYEVFELADISAQIAEAFNAIGTFLIAIGAISLVVAGVSILNVMLMSTIERRTEIGVLRAVGVQKIEILGIILVEALLLGVIGGVVGVFLSIGAGMAVSQFILEDPFGVFTLANFAFIGQAYAFGLGASLISGLYPAWRAANLNPVDALRG